MMLLRTKKNASRKAQTALEYFMVLITIIIPMAMWINSASKGESDDQEEQKHVVKKITEAGIGTDEKLGVIGRPYP